MGFIIAMFCYCCHSEVCSQRTTFLMELSQDSPALSYKLIIKDELPLVASRHSAISGPDVRQCAHQCLLQKWCFAFGHNPTTGECISYAQMAANMHTLSTAARQGFNYYARNVIEAFRAQCQAKLAADAQSTQKVAYFQGRCYTIYKNIANFNYNTAKQTCKAKGDANGFIGRLAFMKSKTMLDRLGNTFSAVAKAAYIEGFQANQTMQPYGNWVYPNKQTGQYIDFHLPPSVWGSDQPNLPSIQSYLRAAFGPSNEPMIKDYHYAAFYHALHPDGFVLCEFEDPEGTYEPTWVPAGQNEQIIEEHVLDKFNNILTIEGCGILCKKRIDCASIAFNSGTLECKLQRFEYNEAGANHIPVNVGKTNASGFTFYDEL